MGEASRLTDLAERFCPDVLQKAAAPASVAPTGPPKRAAEKYYLDMAEGNKTSLTLDEEQSIFAPNHYCVHHGGVQHEGQIKMAEAVNHNYDRKLNRVTHYDMRLQDGTILESVPAEDIQVVRASLAEEHSHEGGCPSEEGDVAFDISQLSPEEAFEAGMAAARDTIDQAMGGPDGPPPEGGFAAEPAMD
jgi:hypothetical protein